MESKKYVGVVEWFKGTYGFIKRQNEPDIFVHWSDIAMEGYKVLKKGQQVAFSIGVNNSGTPKATEVVVINESDKETV